MSARGILVTGPVSRGKILSESKRYIPLFWLSLLSSDDIANAEHNGKYQLDRKRAVQQSLDSLPFLSALFPQVPKFGEIANPLLEKMRASRSKTIGMEVVELVCEDDYGGALPTIGAAVKAIETRDAGYMLKLPARAIPNPFLPGEFVQAGGRTLSIQSLLMEVCLICEADLISKSRESVRCTISGYVWP